SRTGATTPNAPPPHEGNPGDGRRHPRQEALGTPGRADARARRRGDGRRASESGEDPRPSQEHRPDPHDHVRGAAARDRPGAYAEGIRDGGNPVNLRKHELIGLQVEVVAATDPSQEHLRGRVVDETRNTLVLDVRGDEKRIPKEGSRFSSPRTSRTSVFRVSSTT